MNIDKIISESINDFVNEVVVNKFNPYTPEEARINKLGIGRMGNPSYDSAVKADTSMKRNFERPTYEEWKTKYPQMSYREYCYKIYGVNLR